MASSARGSARNAERLAATLALMAGYVDAYGFINFRTYLSFMSGNTTQTGSRIGQGNLAAALPSAIAIVFFVIGVFSGALLAYSGLRQTQRLSFGLVAALLAAVLVLTRLGALVSVFAIAALSLAMGVMNAAMTHVGARSQNFGFVTGTLNTMAHHLAQAIKRLPLPDARGPWDTQIYRALLMFSIWFAFFSGALLSGMATSRYGVWMLLPPLLVLLALSLWRSPRM